MIIGLCGLKGSGKDTVANILIKNHNFVKLSFAGAVKDVASNIFGWDREMMEGLTTKSRNFREEQDIWWSNKLERNITPRNMMQYIGTNLFRDNFHPDIWLSVVERQILKNKLLKINTVITDCRFDNEIKMIRENCGYIIHIEKDKPYWFDDYKNGKINEIKNVHKSELEWIRSEIDLKIKNDSDLEELENIINLNLNILEK